MCVYSSETCLLNLKAKAKLKPDKPQVDKSILWDGPVCHAGA